MEEICVPLITLKQMLRDAADKRYAVGSFNVANHSMVEATLRAAENVGVPVIISIAERHFRYLDVENFVAYVRHRVERAAVPVCLHLDHASTVNMIQRGIDLGFSSVMIDGSARSYDENVALTRQAVELAKSRGVSVEGELGYVEGEEGAFDRAMAADSSRYTDPEKALEFVESTGVDALAIAIGTVHGLYKGAPHLEFERLARIRSLVSIPLVLHGSSGLSEETLRQAITYGINKVNVFTESSLIAVDEIKERLQGDIHIGFPDLLNAAEHRITLLVENQLRVYGTRPIG